MAPIFRLTDGTTTVQLNTGAILTLNYPMATPEVDGTVVQNLGDGDTLSVPSWKNVTETLELLIAGANVGAVRDSIQSVEKLLDKARQNRLTWRGVKVWIEVQFDHDSGVWRSEILAGRLLHKQIADEIWRAKVETALIITRRYFWEGELAQVQLTSAEDTTPTTGYVTVYNSDDGGAATVRNWFQVADSQVSGVIPAPLRIEIHNGSGADRIVKSVHLGNYVQMDPTHIDPIIRGSQAAYIDTSWTGAGETVVYRWALAQALLDDLAGQYCRILIALSTLPGTSTLARARLQFTDTFYDLVIGEQVKVNGEAILDLGAMPIPPGGPFVGSNTYTYLTLTMQAPTSSGDSVGVDWLQIMPAGHGLYRQLRGLSPAAEVLGGGSLYDDGPENLIFAVADTTSYVVHRGIHAPLHVWPGVTQTLRLMKQGNGSLTAGEAYGVKAWYRPRRLTV